MGFFLSPLFSCLFFFSEWEGKLPVPSRPTPASLCLCSCSCAKTGKLVLTQGAKQAGRRLCLCLCSALALLFCSRRKEIFRRSPPPVRASRVFIFIPSSCHLSELVSCHFILLFVSFAAHSHYEPTCTIANAHQRLTLGRRRRRVG